MAPEEYFPRFLAPGFAPRTTRSETPPMLRHDFVERLVCVVINYVVDLGVSLRKERRNVFNEFLSATIGSRLNLVPFPSPVYFRGIDQIPPTNVEHLTLPRPDCIDSHSTETPASPLRRRIPPGNESIIAMTFPRPIFGQPGRSGAETDIWFRAPAG